MGHRYFKQKKALAMTKKKLNDISQEIKSISYRLSILDPNNLIESQLRTQLFHRWDFLDYQLDCALILAKKNRIHTVNNNNLSYTEPLQRSVRNNTSQIQRKHSSAHLCPSVKNRKSKLRIVT